MSAKISDLPLHLRLFLLGGLALLAGLCLENGGSAQRNWRSFGPPLERPLPEGLSRFSLAAALGDHSRVAADWAYIDCLQYLGGANNSDGYFRKILPLYSEVQWLDPSFRHAIREGVTALGWLLRRPTEAEQLAHLALRTDPKDGRYGAYMAALAYQEHVNPAGVIEALRPELVKPDCPEMLLRMAGNIYLKQADWESAYKYWRWVASRAKESVTLKMADQSLKKSLAGLAQEGLPIPAVR